MSYTVLITGGSGLVGYGIKQHINKYPTYNFIFLSSNHCDLSNYQQSLEYFHKVKPDSVIHLAANVGGLFKNINNNVEMFEKNLLINMNLLKICHKLGIKKVVSCLSTCVFPDKTQYPINEEMLHNGPPHWSNEGYAYAKRMLEIQSKLYRNQYNNNFICVIPTNIYGINDNFHPQNSHVVPALIEKIFNGYVNNKKIVKLWGTGNALRDFLYVDDVAKAILFLTKNYYNHELINIGSGKEVSIKYLSKLISNIIGFKGKIIFDSSVPDGTPRKILNTSKINNLGWKPSYNLQEGLKKTISWYILNIKNIKKK